MTALLVCVEKMLYHGSKATVFLVLNGRHVMKTSMELPDRGCLSLVPYHLAPVTYPLSPVPCPCFLSLVFLVLSSLAQQRRSPRTFFLCCTRRARRLVLSPPDWLWHQQGAPPCHVSRGLEVAAHGTTSIARRSCSLQT